MHFWVKFCRPAWRNPPLVSYGPEPNPSHCHSLPRPLALPMDCAFAAFVLRHILFPIVEDVGGRIQLVVHGLANGKIVAK